MRKTFILLMFSCLCLTIKAQQCNVQGVIQYFYNDFIGFKPDRGAEILFVKYSSSHKIPKIKKWDAYQTLVDNWIKYEKLRHTLSKADSEKYSGFKEEYVDSTLALSGELLSETWKYEENNMIKYSAVVDASGKYSISLPYGTYYIWIKSKNRKLPTLLENKQRQRMIRVVLNSPTKVISYDFDIPR